MGHKIVLTSDRTLMSEYNGGIFLGFSACVPHGLLPDSIYFSLFCPSVPINKDGSAKFAPCGLRKIEAALLNMGYKREDIIVAHPDKLEKVVGSNTKILCISENDPLGMGPATTTFRQLFNGEAYMTIKLKEILNNSAVQKYKPKIVIGGAGAWQLENSEVRKTLGIDCVVIGEGESVIGPLFKRAFDGESLPEVVQGQIVETPDIPLIADVTIDGIVEIARGCGRGCAFCVPTLQRFRCVPVENILKEVDVNLKAGKRPLLHAEDVLRYKANGFEVNTSAVKELFSKVYSQSREHNHPPGASAIALSHFALSSVVSAPDLIRDLSDIIELAKGDEWFSGQCGIETGSPKLIGNLMAGKAKPFEPEEWPRVVEDAFRILNENNWVPLSTLIIGLPGEENEDVQLTIDLVNKLEKYKSLLVPLFMVEEGGLKGKASSFSIDSISSKQSELFLKCWMLNLEWSETLLKEYNVTRGAKGYGLRLFFSYGVKETKKIIKTCEQEYGYNLPAMIKDAKAGKFAFTSMPLRLMYKVLKPRKNR